MRFEIREFCGGSDGPFWWVMDTHWMDDDGDWDRAVTICFALEETAQKVCDILNAEWADMQKAIA